MSESPFYNPSQAGIDEKIKAAISSLRSEVQSLINSESSKSSRSGQPSFQSAVFEAQQIASQTNDAGPVITNFSPQGQGPQFNYTTDANYNGQDVRFVLAGQVLTPEEASQFGELNYIDLGGGGSSCVGLAIYTKVQGTPPEQQTQVWVDAGTVAGQLPSGFDYFNGKFIANGGSGTVWIELNINENTGEIVSVAVDSGSEVPQRTNSSFYYALGYYEYTESGGVNITNYGCGSVNAAICRNWFTATPPFYGVSFSR